jgi:hypothetical protein
MDKRKAWRTQEQDLVARWNSALARHNDVLAEIALAGGAVRRKVARLKVEFNSGKRY